MSILSNLSIDHFLEKETVAAEFVCPICLSIMFKICEFDVCGHLFCENCIQHLNECSLCRNQNVRYHESKYLQRKLYNQNIKCPVVYCDQTFQLTQSKDHMIKYHTGLFSQDSAITSNPWPKEVGKSYQSGMNDYNHINHEIVVSVDTVEENHSVCCHSVCCHMPVFCVIVCVIITLLILLMITCVILKIVDQFE